MGAPWLNTKLVVAVWPDTDLDNPGDVYHAIATRCDPARDIIIVPNTRGSPYDPSARPLDGQYPWRIVGKMGIDATIKSRHDPARFRARLAGQLGQGEARRLSVKEDIMDAISPPKPQGSVRGPAVHPLYARGRFRSEAQARGRAVQEAHGLPAECAQALCLPARDRRNAVEAQQQRHARSFLHARPASQAQACRGCLRHQRLRLLHGAQLLHVEESRRTSASKDGA